MTAHLNSKVKLNKVKFNSPVGTVIQRWVIAIKKTNQLPTTLLIILYLVIGITN